MDKDSGADPALAKAEPVARLGPSGFDPGEVYRVRYPFVRCAAEIFTDNGPQTIPSWRPGVDYESYGPYGDVKVLAHAEGEMVLAVEAVFKPGRFPTRVFYTRKFVTPEGKKFGKGGLRIASVEKFRRLVGGYRGDYEIEDDPIDGSTPPIPAPLDCHGFAGHAGTDSLPTDEDLPW